MVRFCSTHAQGGKNTLKAIRQNIKMCNGGQSTQGARQIANILDRVPHDTLVEPFLGVGNTYRAFSPVEREILNDKDCKRVKIAKARSCASSDKTQCERMKKARVTCGRNYNGFVKKYDKKGVLIYLDPPYEKTLSNLSVQAYKHRGTSVKFEDVLKAAKTLKRASVAISYSNKPEFRKRLCVKPFRCHRIHKHIMSVQYDELLAVRKR